MGEYSTFSTLSTMIIGLYFGGLVGIGGLSVFILSLYTTSRTEKIQYALLTIFWPASVGLLLIMRMVLGAHVYQKLKAKQAANDQASSSSNSYSTNDPKKLH